MNLKTRPFLITVGLCLGLQAILMSLSAGIPVFFNRQSQSFTLVPQTDDIQTQLLFTLANGGVCLCMFGVDILTGALYAFLGARQPPFSTGAGALGGAAASAGVRLFSSLFSLCVALLLLPLVLGQDLRLVFAGGLAGGIITLLTDLFYVVVAALLGAAGGAIVVKIARRPAAPSPA